jgi:hypothetical protein
MKRISVNLTPEQAAGLKARARETGVPQSEQIRRAIASSFSGPAGDFTAAGHLTPARQPVLFTKQEPR